jgi:hypothetical protein
MSPKDRKSIGQPTATEAIQRCEHRTSAANKPYSPTGSLFMSGRANLTFNWGKTHQKSSCRVGWHDFSIYRGGKCLLIELKAPGGRLTEEQISFRERLEAQGFDNCIARDAAQAIEASRHHLFERKR